MIDKPVKWPKGYAVIYRNIMFHSRKIMNGTLLAIDPSSGSESSQPAFSVFVKGELTLSGELTLPPKHGIATRLQLLDTKIRNLLPAPPTVLAIEEIQGQNFSHRYLQWAIGCIVSASRTPSLIQVPTNMWKAVARASSEYQKSDVNDALIIGQTIVLLAKKFNDAENQMEVLAEITGAVERSSKGKE